MDTEEQSLLRQHPSRMEQSNFDDPLEALEHFFEWYDLPRARKMLWELYERCVLSYAHNEEHHQEAAEVLSFYQQAELLVEAAWLIHHREQQQQKEA